MIAWVRAPHFCAGLVFDAETALVTEAAPILKWAVGKSWAYCAGYFARKKYEVVLLDGPDRTEPTPSRGRATGPRTTGPRDSRS